MDSVDDSETIQLQLSNAQYTSSKFVALYHKARPSAPTSVVDFILLHLSGETPNLVVDLGSGTGHSTRLWSDYAKSVIGIEPNELMRAKAIAESLTLGNIEFVPGSSSKTGLPSNSVDIVTCAQSFHWMNPESTILEVVRILKPQRVFAAYDYTYVPYANWQVEGLLRQFKQECKAIETDKKQLRWWPREHRRHEMEASGQFQFISQASFLVGHTLDRYAIVDRIMSVSMVQLRLKENRDLTLSLLDGLLNSLYNVIGEKKVPVYFQYYLWIGIT